MKAIPPPAADARLDDQEGRDCGGHRSRDAARTRQRLLHTAARLFAANGYAATTVREIAHEADVIADADRAGGAGLPEGRPRGG